MHHPVADFQRLISGSDFPSLTFYVENRCLCSKSKPRDDVCNIKYDSCSFHFNLRGVLESTMGLIHKQCVRTNLCLNCAYDHLTHKSGIQQYFLTRICSYSANKFTTASDHAYAQMRKAELT